jgi:phosphatidylinositol glycan class H protein
MLTVAPTLRVRRPSPTTVEYIVSTRPPSTVSFSLLLGVLTTIRFLLLLSIALILFCKWQLHPSAPWLLPYSPTPDAFTLDYVWHSLALLHASQLGLAATHVASLVPLFILLPLAAAFAYLSISRIHTEESLLVLRGLGIQTCSSSSTYLTGASTQFIPTQKIQDLLINEAFRGFEVRYYLVVVVEGEKEVVVVFPKTLPRRRVVEEVWRGGRQCLYGRVKAVDKASNGKA